MQGREWWTSTRGNRSNAGREPIDPGASSDARSCGRWFPLFGLESHEPQSRNPRFQRSRTKRCDPLITNRTMASRSMDSLFHSFIKSPRRAREVLRNSSHEAMALSASAQSPVGNRWHPPYPGPAPPWRASASLLAAHSPPPPYA